MTASATATATAADLGSARTLLTEISAGVDEILDEFLHRQDARAGHILEDRQCRTQWLGFTHSLRQLLFGGKRIRAAFCHLGWRGAGGQAGASAVRTAAAALELLHAFALVHDDVIDASDIRRGQPTVHRQHAVVHREQRWNGDADHHGTSVALLAGDLLLGWCHELLDEAAVPVAQREAARAVLRKGFRELVMGQYLDVLAQTGALAGAVTSTVNRLKTAKYTVERPLHLGAALAGADPAGLATYSAYALPVGEAFQLRDDILGVFGDPALTGKPVTDDLRSGKATLLITLARQRADRSQSAKIDALLGRPDLDDDGARCLARIIADTGARTEVERRIHELADAARRAADLVDADDTVRQDLHQLVALLVDRER